MRYARTIRLPAGAYADRETAFHVTIRTHPDVGALRLPVRAAVWASLLHETTGHAVAIAAAVLMPDHLHVIARPEDLDLVAWVARFKSLSTRAAWAEGHHGTLWQRRFHDRALRQPEVTVAIDYVLRNASTAGLVEHDADWPHRWVSPDLS